jgi:RNA polymerase primary sigma factor
MANIYDKIQKFISNYPDLVEQFNNYIGVPFDQYEEEITCCYYNIKKESPFLTFDNICEIAINNALKCGNLWDGFTSIINQVEDGKIYGDSIQQYFKEINDIYEKHNNDYNIEYCPENRDKLIEMNLKTVISIAKKYQGLGLSLNELISAGNLGLVIAYDKFDPHRSKLREDILNAITNLPNIFTYNELLSCIKDYLTYGDIKKKFLDHFLQDQTYNKHDLEKWIYANIHNAKFNSIATMWIRAYILIEIDNNSRIVKKPKSEIYKDKEKEGAYKKEIVIDIDAPINDDSDTCVGDLIYLEDETKNDLDIGESYDIFKEGLNKLLTDVKARDRSIFLKKFGIGLPRPMLPKEIADQEGLSIARVSQIFQSVIEQMQVNQVKYNIDPIALFEVVKKIN